MNYRFNEIKQFNTHNNDTSFLKDLNAIQVTQLREAIKPHVGITNGDVQTFKNCFFPVYPNNEGGIELITFYEILDDKQTIVFDLVKVDQSAGTFFKHGTTQISAILSAGLLAQGSAKTSEILDLERAWVDFYKRK